MLGRNGNVAYVRYDSQGRIVPGGPIISAQRPKVGFWQPVSNVIGTSVTSSSLRAFVRIDYANRVVPSSLLLLSKAPDAADSGTHWLEINATYRPQISPTTTTTTTHIITTTTTTTSGGSTTTTTTTSGGTTSTTTTLIPVSTTTTTTTQAYYPVTVYVQGNSANDQLCPQGSTGIATLNYFCSTPVLQAGSILYNTPGNPVGDGGFSYKQVGYDTVWYPICNGALIQECLNAGTLTGKITTESSVPCNGNGTDITFTSTLGFSLGYRAIVAAGPFTFSGAGFTIGSNIRLLQTGTNVWFTYNILNDIVAIPVDSPCNYSPNTCPTTTTTTTSAVLDCALGAVVNPTFVGGPVGVTVEQRCTGGNPPFLVLTDYTGGSGSYTLLTFEGAPLLQYPDASYATTPILPTPINDGYTISKLFTPGWPPGTTFWIVFADFYNHSNQILVTIVIEACPTPPPSNTVFMKFDIL